MWGNGAAGGRYTYRPWRGGLVAAVEGRRRRQWDEPRRRRHVDKWCTAAFTRILLYIMKNEKKKIRHAPNRFNGRRPHILHNIISII